MLELLVQDEPLRARYVVIPARLSSQIRMERLTPEKLPANCRDPAAREDLQAIGEEWTRRASSAVLAVPSAIIPVETNYLLNPMHPAFARIEIVAPATLITGLRLVSQIRQ